MSNVHPWKTDTNVNLQMSMIVASSKSKCLLFSQYFCSEGRDPFKKYTWQKSLHLKFPHRICFKVFPFQHRPITWEGVPNQTLGWAGSLKNFIAMMLYHLMQRGVSLSFDDLWIQILCISNLKNKCLWLTMFLKIYRFNNVFVSLLKYQYIASLNYIAALSVSWWP